MKWKIHAVHHVNYLEPIGYYVNKRTLLRHEINTIRQIGSIEEKIQRENLQKYAKIRAKSINKCIFLAFENVYISQNIYITWWKSVSSAHTQHTHIHFIYSNEVLIEIRSLINIY